MGLICGFFRGAPFSGDLLSRATLTKKGVSVLYLVTYRSFKPLRIQPFTFSYFMLETHYLSILSSQIRPKVTPLQCSLNGTPLQHSCLENPMDGGAWWAAVHGVARSRTQLSDFTFTFHFNALEREMATHSSVLAWRIPGTGEPGGLPSMGSHRVGHD